MKCHTLAQGEFICSCVSLLARTLGACQRTVLCAVELQDAGVFFSESGLRCQSCRYNGVSRRQHLGW